MYFQAMSKEEFIEMRWKTYQETLKNKQKLAKELGTTEDCIYIGEPPVSGEVICDICNAEVLGKFVILDQQGSYLYCTKCAKEASK